MTSNQHTDYVHSLSCGSLTVKEIKTAPGVSDWKSFTPTIITAAAAGAALGTGGTTTGKYRLIGQTLDIQIFHNQTAAGSTGSPGIYLFALPTGAVAADTAGCKGVAMISGTNSYMAVVVLAGSSIALNVCDPGGTTLAQWTPQMSLTELRLGSTTFSVSLTATIPLAPTSPILRQ